MRTTTMSIVTGAVLALSAASASAQTGPFAGPYLGVQGGVSANELDFTGTFTDPLGTDTLETEFGATGVVGGVYGGFGGSFDSVAVGLEGDFSWNGAENESTTTTTVPGGIGTSITSEFQESYGVSALVGMAPSPTAMPNTTIASSAVARRPTSPGLCRRLRRPMNEPCRARASAAGPARPVGARASEGVRHRGQRLGRQRGPDPEWP